VRSMLARTELGLAGRMMLADNEPFSAGVFTGLWYGSKLLDNSQRNGVTWDAGVLASLTAAEHVTIVVPSANVEPDRGLQLATPSPLTERSSTLVSPHRRPSHGDRLAARRVPTLKHVETASLSRFVSIVTWVPSVTERAPISATKKESNGTSE